jgi:hypothetical protein
MSDEENTPLPQRRQSPHREAVVALTNLSISLNGYASRMAIYAKEAAHRGVPSDVAAAIGKDLRTLGKELVDTAQMVDPQPLAAASGR